MDCFGCGLILSLTNLSRHDRLTVPMSDCTSCPYHTDDTCPWPQCIEDCHHVNDFRAPLRRRAIREAAKVFPNVGVLSLVFRVKKTVVYLALNETCMYSKVNHMTCKECPLPCDYLVKTTPSIVPTKIRTSAITKE